MDLALLYKSFNILVEGRMTQHTDLCDVSSSTAEKEQPNTELAMFAPLESDLDESANSVPEHQVNQIFYYFRVTLSLEAEDVQ